MLRDDLNYQHLYYFWVIATQGGIARAGKMLRLTHSTLSVQLRSLEDHLGAPLFERQGRNLVLTALGCQMQGYAEDVFRLGRELVEVARGQKQGRVEALRIGLLSSIPRAFAYELIQPGLQIADNVAIQLRQAEAPRLLEQLAAGQLHVVISDAPAAPDALKLHSHALGNASNLLFGSPALAHRFGCAIPGSLDGAPVLLPTAGAVRDGVLRWFCERELAPRVAGEFDDAGMLRIFGARGHGLFAVRSALRTEVEEAHGAVCLTPLEGVVEAYYAISVERRIRHDGVAAIIERARAELGAALAVSAKSRS